MIDLNDEELLAVARFRLEKANKSAERERIFGYLLELMTPREYGVISIHFRRPGFADVSISCQGKGEEIFACAFSLGPVEELPISIRCLLLRVKEHFDGK